MKPEMTPTATETASAMSTIGSETLAGRSSLSITAATAKDSATPIEPPIRQIADASRRNWRRIERRFAPMALRMPISRVRSVTDTNMMFMTPTPPTNREMPVTAMPIASTTPMTLLKADSSESILLIAKSSSSLGRRRRILRISPTTSYSKSASTAPGGALTAMSKLRSWPPNSRTKVVTGTKIWLSKSGPPKKPALPCFSITPTTRNSERPILIFLLIGSVSPKSCSRMVVPSTQTRRLKATS